MSWARAAWGSNRSGQLGQGRGGARAAASRPAMAPWRALAEEGRLARSGAASREWFHATRGREGGFGRRSGQVASQVAPTVGVVQGKQRKEERDAVGGNFVISSKFKISYVNSIFLPLLGLK